MKLSLFLLIFFSSPLFAIDYKIEQNKSSLNSLAKKISDSILSKLPKEVKNLPITINIQTKKVNKKQKEQSCDSMYYGNIFSKVNYKKRTIVLHSSILECKDLLEKVILFRTGQIIDYNSHYPSSRTISKETGGKPRTVTTYLHQKNNFNFSHSQEFVYLSGWKYSLPSSTKPVSKSREIDLNDMSQIRSIHVLFAINFLRFINDKEFMCRKPNIYKFYKKIFKIKENTECTRNNILIPLTVANSYKLVNVNIDEIAEIHYLYANPGKKVISNWGHSMYRFVFCPQSKSIIYCRSRSKYNMILNFTGFTPSSKRNMISGIIGKYPSRLTFHSLKEIKWQNNIVEERDLYSYKLLLSKEQLKKALTHGIDQVWNYYGDYKFLNNNCADEALDFIKALFSDHPIQSQSVLTPLNLIKILKKHKIIMPYKNDSNSIYEAKKNKIFFPAQKIGALYKEKLEEIFDLDYNSYTSLDATQRSYLIINKKEEILKQSVAPYLFRVEIKIMELLKLKISKIKIQEYEASVASSDQNAKTFALVRDIFHLPDSSYGIPFNDEITTINDDFYKKIEDVAILNNKEFYSYINDQIEQIKTNLSLISKINILSKEKL